MSNIVSLGDIVTLCTQAYKIYTDIKTIPADLQTIAASLHELAKDVKHLNDILLSQRREQYREYDDTQSLQKDVNEAIDFLKRYSFLENPQSPILRRIGSTIRAKWDWDTIQSYVQSMENHRRRVERFQSRFLIQTLTDHTELHICVINLLLRNWTALSTRSSLNAIRRLCDGQAVKDTRDIPEIEDSTPLRRPSRPALPSTIDDAAFQRTLVRFIEQRRLYDPQTRDNTSIHKIEYLSLEDLVVDVLSPAVSAQPEVQIAHGNMIGGELISARVEQNSPSSGDLTVSSTIEGLASTPVSPHSASASPTTTLDRARSRSRSFILGPAALRLASDFSAVDTDPLGGTMDESLQLIRNDVCVTAPIGIFRRGISCTLSIVKQGRKTYIKSESKEKFPSDSMPSFEEPSGACTPFLEPKDGVSTQFSLVLLHEMSQGLASFPRIVHSSGEIFDQGFGRKYNIGFYTDQALTVDNYPGLSHRSLRPVYSFQEKRDRDVIREKIFGRQLLASASASNIEFDLRQTISPCRMQPFSLWKNITKATSRSSLADEITMDSQTISITIQCSAKGSRTTPDSAMELQILGIENLSAAAASQVKLKLRVRVVETTADCTHAGHTLPSKMRRFSLNRASTAPSTPRVFSCYITFTDNTEERRIDKRHFLNQLSKSFPDRT